MDKRDLSGLSASFQKEQGLLQALRHFLQFTSLFLPLLLTSF